MWLPLGECLGRLFCARHCKLGAWSRGHGALAFKPQSAAARDFDDIFLRCRSESTAMAASGQHLLSPLADFFSAASRARQHCAPSEGFSKVGHAEAHSVDCKKLMGARATVIVARCAPSAHWLRAQASALAGPKGAMILSMMRHLVLMMAHSYFYRHQRMVEGSC